MHTIKSQARYHAWHGDGISEPKGISLIPYANRHYRSRSRARADEEAALEHYDSTPERPPAANGPSPTSVRRSTEPGRPPFSELSDTDQKDGLHSAGTSATLTSGDASESPTSSSTANGLRKRHAHISDDSPEQSEAPTRPSKKKFWKGSFWKGSNQDFTLVGQLRAIFWSYPNILLVCVPVGIALGALNDKAPANQPVVQPIAVFVLNFLAIIPLAAMLSFATEEIAMRTGETIGGLLNASFGNATELIVAIIALAKGEILIVQTSLVGSMLSNLLLVMGMCFLLGGYNRVEQHFNMTVAQTACSLLALAVGSLIIPTVFQQWSQAPNNLTMEHLPALSQGTAIILLFVYGCYLFFQLRTHSEIYNAKSEKVEKTNLVRSKRNSVSAGISTMGASHAAVAGGAINEKRLVDGQDKPPGGPDDGEEDDGEKPQISGIVAIVLLCAATAFIGACSDYLVSSISEVVIENNISPEFVGLILLPIIGNAAEHATAVTVAMKDKMDLAIGVAVGSSMQIALLVLPLSVVIGWIVSAVNPSIPAMTLNFDGFIIAVLFVAVLLVNYLIQDGKSHWLEGVMLMTTYIIIAVAAWFYPASTDVVG